MFVNSGHCYLAGRRSLLLYTVHPLSPISNCYIYLSKGEEKNLLANEMSLQILGGGQMCASHQSRYTPSHLGERVEFLSELCELRNSGEGSLEFFKVPL